LAAVAVVLLIQESLTVLTAVLEVAAQGNLELQAVQLLRATQVVLQDTVMQEAQGQGLQTHSAHLVPAAVAVQEQRDKLEQLEQAQAQVMVEQVELV
jgi:hypothetical protein